MRNIEKIILDGTENKLQPMINKLNELNSEMNCLVDSLNSLNSKRADYLRENNIKKLFPKKNKVYKVINCASAPVYPYSSACLRDVNNNELFFKPKKTRLCISDVTSIYKDGRPWVSGDLLNENFNIIQKNIEIYITNLIDVSDDSIEEISNRVTKVYVMIDKNTGFFKIGRSKNPNTRERTLQSEKPTIEMLFVHDARVYDEKKLHDIFHEKRVRGEWFNLNGTDLLTIRKYFNSN